STSWSPPIPMWRCSSTSGMILPCSRSARYHASACWELESISVPSTSSRTAGASVIAAVAGEGDREPEPDQHDRERDGAEDRGGAREHEVGDEQHGAEHR